MAQLYVLFEHVSGFAVFRTTEFEEIAIFLPQVRESICDISKFRSIVYLVAFQPFKEQKNSLENVKSIVSDELSTDLQLFLENNIPRSKKSKQAVVLGVLSTGLASTISEKLGMNCVSSLVVAELLRGIRFHFPKLIKGFKDESYLRQSALAMGHHYSRNKINFSRQDCMVIESHDLIDELEKDIRTSARRIKGWYSQHFPELHNVIGDDVKLYVTCVAAIGNRKNMPEDIEEKLNSFINDSSKVQSILEAVHNSMGMDISSVDLQNLQMFCKRVLSLIDSKQSNLEYLKTKMKTTAPNMSSLVGEVVGSRLISRAGGLNKLAILPASTLQILGADKKLFRTVKGKAEKDPMCGLLSQSEILSKIQKRNKGRMSRMLANKCCLAVRVDCFKKATNETFGSELLQQVEKSVQIREKIKPVANKTLPEGAFEKKTVPKEKAAGYKKSKMTDELDDSMVNEDVSMEVNGSLHLSGAETSEENEMDEDTVKNKEKRSGIEKSKHVTNDANSNKKGTNYKKEKVFREENEKTSEDLEVSTEAVSEVKELKKTSKKRKSKTNEQFPEGTFKKASEVQKKGAVERKTPLKKRKKTSRT